MKTLAQVEPRTPIADVHYTITQPGSYYLTANRTETVASSAGIWIYTNDVTLDLNGFTIRGGVYSQGGILYPGCQVIGNTCAGNNISGSISGAGIFVDDSNDRIEGNHVNANGYAGISVYSSYMNNVVVRNTVSGNGANNYVVNTANNDVGPIGVAATATSPWANISH